MKWIDRLPEVLASIIKPAEAGTRPSQTSAPDNEFSYLLERIAAAEFCDEPFRHLYFDPFLSDEHFALLTTDAQIDLPPGRDTAGLIQMLVSEGWSVQPFPGCTTSIEQYLACLESNEWPVDRKRLEGFGVALRLTAPQNPRIAALLSYLNSAEFKAALTRKFAITRPSRMETAIHKYLSGYEISPHPDIRKKCLTYLVNINTTDTAAELDIHTHLLTFRDEYKFISEFWRFNPQCDTDWVPWDWCETIKRTARNNSLLVFAPLHNTLHAVKLRYNHLEFQRTQLYGNLWYTDVEFAPPRVTYERFLALRQNP